jgi:hypothetical protein
LRGRQASDQTKALRRPTNVEPTGFPLASQEFLNDLLKAQDDIL